MGGAFKILTLLPTPFPLLYPRPSSLRLARRSGVPLSSAAGSRDRRILSAGSGTRSNFAPHAAEQVHTQAGAREGFIEPVAPRAAHQWPEWASFFGHVAAGGYTHRQGAVAANPGGGGDDSFVEGVELTEEFSKSCEACLAFAREQPDLLRLLSKKDIEAVVENGLPFLFRNGENSTRRLRSFLNGGSNPLQSERAETIDVMRYLLSYASNPCSPIGASPETKELTDASVRNLLVALSSMHRTVQESSFTDLNARQPSLQQQQQFSRPPEQNVEMRRGDWICPKCSFMNFAKNTKCLECNEVRPKRVLTGREWECPQCDFYNYGRNVSCLRCDCKQPGEIPLNAAFPDAGLGYNRSPSVEQILNGSNKDKSKIEKKLAANDEKAERWLSKVSQLDNSLDSSNMAADEGFPEIMPMRNGANKFVGSTRNTLLERQMANAQYDSKMTTAATEGSESQPGGLSGLGTRKSSESSISQTLDRILGRATAASATNNQSRTGGPDVDDRNQRRDPDYVPFVPLPADMFAKSQNGSDANADHSGNTVKGRNDEESQDAAQRWSEKAAELGDVAGLSSAISDRDFPEIMPMRKGENRFVVSKKKDRSLTSPQYKRRIAMEQASNYNFVPFVPFPPDYFAKKDKPSEVSPTAGSVPECSQVADEQGETMQSGSQFNSESRSADFSQKNMNTSKSEGNPSYSARQPDASGSKGDDSWNSGYSYNSTLNTSAPVRSPQQESPLNSGESWNKGLSGKSLEGSAVKEPDPLDMSEEAKAERWFRRAAQIKDISELANIPDEDFPEIMPMRKGVNRFVVSKRKTPLERRLASQYRRNLPIIRSEPEEKDAS